MSDQCQPKTQKEAHHIEIQNAVRSLSTVINRLDGLLSEIRNDCGDPPVASGDPAKLNTAEPIVPLAGVLNETAADIHGKREQMQGLIIELRNELF